MTDKVVKVLPVYFYPSYFMFTNNIKIYFNCICSCRACVACDGSDARETKYSMHFKSIVLKKGTNVGGLHRCFVLQCTTVCVVIILFKYYN